MFYSPQGEHIHLRHDCPDLKGAFLVIRGRTDLPDCKLCQMYGRYQILPKVPQMFREMAKMMRQASEQASEEGKGR